jgi:hypothetical protein
MPTLTVAYFNQYDQPDWERAKLRIGEWMNTTERGQWLRDRFTQLRWQIEPDGGMEPHYWVELELQLSDHDCTLYAIRWPTPWQDGIQEDEQQKQYG